MLTLADASAYFDRTPIVDPATGKTLFYGQVDPYADAVRDSATAYRRVLSVVPGTTIPASRVVKIFGQVWIIGDSELDGLETRHREKFVLHPAKTLLNIGTLSGYLTATVASTSWADVTWVKDAKEDAVSSRSVPQFSVFLPRPAAVAEYSVMWDTDGAYLAQPVHPVPSGIKDIKCLKLEFAPADATLATRTFDPVAGAYSSSITSTVKCLRVRWQSLFKYGSQGDAKFQEGDDSLVLPTGTVISTKDTLTLAGKTWKILSVETLGGAVVAHGRPA